MFPFQLTHLAFLSRIQEWQLTSFAHFSADEGLLLALLALLMLGRVRVPPLRMLVLLLLVPMGLAHARHVALWGFIIPLLLAPEIGAGFPELLLDEENRGWAAAALAVAVLGSALRLVSPVRITDRRDMPVSALADVPSELRSQPVLNGYELGGYLELKGIRVWIDGRAELFGDAFLDQYAAMADGSLSALKDQIAR